MNAVTIPEITVRTTNDGDGYSHDVIAVTAEAPGQALTNLKTAARALAAELAGSAGVKAGRDSGWGLEVIDVRVVAGPADGESGWCAYGTLRSTGMSPLIPDDVPWHGRR